MRVERQFWKLETRNLKSESRKVDAMGDPDRRRGERFPRTREAQEKSKVKGPTRKPDVWGTHIRIRIYRPGHPPGVNGFRGREKRKKKAKSKAPHVNPTCGAPATRHPESSSRFMSSPRAVYRLGHPPREAASGGFFCHGNLLIACMKIATYNYHRSAPFFQALVVCATKSTRSREPTPSSNQPLSNSRRVILQGTLIAHLSKQSEQSYGFFKASRPSISDLKSS